MKKSILLAASLLAFNLTPVFGQLAPIPIAPAAAPQIQPRLYLPPSKPPFGVAADANAGAPILTKFNLDFPGGTPAELVKAIEKATGQPLNAIIPDEDANTQLPPLKMNDVVAPQLFAALEAASRKTVAYSMGGGGYSQMTTDYGFTTSDNPLTDASIWYFHANKPSFPPMVSTEKVCQFYSLSSYLDRGFTVDDITTAIQTGWKMAGVTPTPELDYHKETGLLIAFGEPQQLKTINDVLGTLPQLKSTYWQDMNKNIFALQQQVKELQTKISATKTNAAPEEKSGK